MRPLNIVITGLVAIGWLATGALSLAQEKPSAAQDAKKLADFNPLGQGVTLSDQDAYDIAAYFTRQPRPDFADKIRIGRKAINLWMRGIDELCATSCCF